MGEYESLRSLAYNVNRETGLEQGSNRKLRERLNLPVLGGKLYIRAS